ncbi:ATP-binding cassette domain-containing protein [Lacunimicrobium album]
MNYSLTCAYEFLPAGMTVRVGRVMDHFGVTKEIGRHVIAEDVSMDVEEGQVIAFTGDSGSGKSSLMRTLAGQLEGVLWFDDITFLKGTVIDQFTDDWAESMALLSACGLGEAHLMLRLPSELSDGQRMRLKLAIGISQTPQWLVIDEFTSSLDRTLAKVIAFNLKKLSRRHQMGVLVATTHEDVIEDLQPDVHVRMRIDGEVEIVNGDGVVCAEKKFVAGSALRRNSGSARGPSGTGRTLLAGIIDRINSDSRSGSLCCGGG